MIIGFVTNCTQWLTDTCSVSPLLMGISLTLSVGALYWMLLNEY